MPGSPVESKVWMELWAVEGYGGDDKQGASEEELTRAWGKPLATHVPLQLGTTGNIRAGFWTQWQCQKVHPTPFKTLDPPLEP